MLLLFNIYEFSSSWSRFSLYRWNPILVLHGIDDAALKFGLPSEKGLKYIIHQGLNVISSCFLDRCFVVCLIREILLQFSTRKPGTFLKKTHRGGHLLVEMTCQWLLLKEIFAWLLVGKNLANGNQGFILRPSMKLFLCVRWCFYFPIWICYLGLR